jgi:hypothetical protein
MAEITFVALMAVGIALGVCMLLTLLLFGLYIVIIEFRYWRRVRRIGKARAEVRRREALGIPVARMVARRNIRDAKNEKFLQDLRKAIDEF